MRVSLSPTVFASMVPAFILFTGCAASPSSRVAPAEEYPDSLPGRLSRHLSAILVKGRLPAMDGLTPEQQAALAHPTTGVVSDYRAWIRYCIAYNRRLEAAHRYEPLPVVRRFQEHPLEMPWRAEDWTRRLTGVDEPLVAALDVYRDAMGVAVPPPELDACPAKSAPPDPLEALRVALTDSATIVDREALGALTPEKRALMHFVVPWINKVGTPFVNRSQGAPAYQMHRIFRPSDPFAPGAGVTPGGMTVPPALYSMTGIYHYLRALAGEPVRTDGIRQDFALAADRPHPEFTNAVDMAAMGSALQRLQPVLNAAALDRLEAELHRLAADDMAAAPEFPGVTGRLLRVEHTPYGALLVGGPGPNHYDDVDAAFIFDLGGDNTYIYRDRPERLTRYPLRVIVDFAGDDLYVAEGAGGPGTGILGIGILIDRQGDDRYTQALSPHFAPRQHTRETLLQADPEGEDTRWVPFIELYGNPEEPDAPGIMLDAGFAFGAAFLGIGILHDIAGNDLYLGQKYCFGSAFWKGLALLCDDGGDDVFAAGHTALGSGINSAVGIVNSQRGDNHYQCLGIFESGYSAGCEWDNGYDGSGLGHGSAWRAEVRSNRAEDRWQATLGGGMGLLCSGAGDDQYLGGAFGVASGYAGGIGMITDRGGDDTYFVKRGPDGGNHKGWSGNHALANGAHRGVGYLLDHAGNDRYSASFLGGANAWDISSAFLLDLGGNDLFTDLHGKAVRGNLGNGAANSFAVCFLHGGSNRLQRASFGSAHWLPEGYPGTDANFSFFINTGLAEDYPPDYTGNTIRLNGVSFTPDTAGGLISHGFGLFADGPGTLWIPDFTRE